MGCDQHVRSITRLVGVLVGIDVNRSSYRLIDDARHIGNPKVRGISCFAVSVVKGAGANRKPGHLGNGVGVMRDAVGIGGNLGLRKNFRRLVRSPGTVGFEL